MVKPDYACLLRRHAARWSVIFAGLIIAWLVSWMASFTVGDFLPTVTVSLLMIVATIHCRIRYRYLRDMQENQADELMISRLRRAMQDAGEI